MAGRTFGGIFAKFLAGDISAPVTTMQLLLATDDPGKAVAAIRAASDTRLDELEGLLAGCADVARTIAAVRETARAKGEDAGGVIARNRAMFDWLVAQSPEASVALYSLGRPDLLDQATAEIVRVLRHWALLGRERRILDLGCGIGRIAAALSPEVESVLGLDIASAMITEARRRCAGLDNVTLRAVSGADLSDVPAGSHDLVLAVDSFPYLVEAGPELVASHFAEIRRVLAPGGDFVIFNYSYSGSVEDDVADTGSLAGRNGLSVLRSAERPFELWDGIAFHFRKAADR